jgi:hypothetical protein
MLYSAFKKNMLHRQEMQFFSFFQASSKMGDGKWRNLLKGPGGTKKYGKEENRIMFFLLSA